MKMKYKNKAGIKNVILSYQQVETIDYPFEYKVTRSGDHYIDAQIDMSVLSLKNCFGMYLL